MSSLFNRNGQRGQQPSGSAASTAQAQATPPPWVEEQVAAYRLPTQVLLNYLSNKFNVPPQYADYYFRAERFEGGAGDHVYRFWAPRYLTEREKLNEISEIRIPIRNLLRRGT